MRFKEGDPVVIKKTGTVGVITTIYGNEINVIRYGGISKHSESDLEPDIVPWPKLERFDIVRVTKEVCMFDSPGFKHSKKEMVIVGEPKGVIVMTSTEIGALHYYTTKELELTREIKPTEAEPTLDFTTVNTKGPIMSEPRTSIDLEAAQQGKQKAIEQLTLSKVGGYAQDTQTYVSLLNKIAMDAKQASRFAETLKITASEQERLVGRETIDALKGLVIGRSEK